MSKLKIEPYDGSSDVVQWVERFRLVVDASKDRWKCKDELALEGRTLTEFKLAMRGTLVDWLKTQSTKNTADDMLNELVLFINGPHAKIDKRAAAFALKKDDCAGVAEYYVKKLALLHDCLDSDDYEKLSTDLFLDGLGEEYRNWVLMQPMSTRDTAAKMKGVAESYERLLASKAPDESINLTKIEEYEEQIKKLENELAKTKRYRNKKYKPQEESVNAMSNRPRCSWCHRFGHEGAWDPLCPHHDPNYKERQSQTTKPNFWKTHTEPNGQRMLLMQRARTYPIRVSNKETWVASMATKSKILAGLGTAV
jgi:hypothetical protein